MLKVEDAEKELESKSYIDIQKETAWKWASRAAACFSCVLEEEGSRRLVMFSMGEEYFHEAIEHASLVRDEDIVTEVINAVTPYEDEAAQELDKILDKEDK